MGESSIIRAVGKVPKIFLHLPAFSENNTMTENKKQPTRESVVTLREITRDTVRLICRLDVKEKQKRFVAPNSISIAEAYFEPKAWFRAIYADETPVGFVMLFDDSEKPVYYLWRYMIDGKYQEFGFGKKALEQVIDYVKTRPDATEMVLSYVPAEGSPQGFYEKLGFRDTGVEHDGELEMKLVFDPQSKMD